MMNPQSTLNISIGAQVINEVLWSLTLGQRSHHTRETDHTSVSISVAEELWNESTDMYTFKVLSSNELIGADFNIQDFLKGLGKNLCDLLSNPGSTSECWLQIGARQYYILPGSDGLRYTDRVLQNETDVTKSSFEFYLRVPSDKIRMTAINLEARLDQYLLRYKLTHPEVSLSLQFNAGGLENNKHFQPLPSSSAVVNIGDVLISRVAENYVPKEYLQRSKVTGIQVGEVVNVTYARDSSMAMCSQIGCLLFDCSHSSASGRVLNTIQIFMHGLVGIPLAAMNENVLIADIVPILRQVLNIECLGFKIKDIHHQLTGAVVPDVSFTVSVLQRNASRRVKLPTPFIVVLHFVWRPSYQRNISNLSMNDILLTTFKSFAHYLQDNATILRSCISELVISILEMNKQESTKQRQRDEMLKKAVPTVVDAITTILGNTTNEIFRRNCLAYAGANSTQEVKEFLTESLTCITEGNFNNHGEDLVNCLHPEGDSLSQEVLPSDLMENDLASTNLEEHLEEVSDVDLLEVFKLTSPSQESSISINDGDASSTSSHQSGVNAGLGHITEEIIKSLLEEEDLFEEQLLNSDWLNEEE